jgi:hypothetical protein
MVAIAAAVYSYLSKKYNIPKHLACYEGTYMALIYTPHVQR